ncbi:MAG: hypothetical protein KBS62_04795 [Oscillospiraceae bacterium]|nr:hypothetical protein [Candidatus Ruminococcus equi]
MKKHKFALIGKNIEKSVSPFIHERLFSLDKIDAEYNTIDLCDKSLESVIPSLKSLSGYNVTVPFKEEIVKYLDNLDNSAQIPMCVNTVKNDKLSAGYLTDSYGFAKSLKSIYKGKIHSAVILGCGGAARAVAFELVNLGATNIHFVIRGQSKEKCKKLINDLNLYGFSGAKILQNADFDYDILVNATPVGSNKNFGCFASDELISRAKVVFDLIYSPSETKLIKKAKAYNKVTINGISMLVYQAAKAHEIFFDSRYDIQSLDKICKETENLLSKRKIILCGFMGSGKTTVGTALSNSLALPFFDLDEYIEINENLTNEKIFSKYGEEYFREIEHKYLCDLLCKDEAVISLGGGTLTQEKSRQLIHSANAFSVFLDITLDTAKKRTENTQRPMLKKYDIESLYKERYDEYKTACDFSVTAEKSTEEIVSAISEVL